MDIVDISEQNKKEYDSVVTHPLQSYAWGEFRKKTGVKVIRRGFLINNKLVDGFTLTIHKVPKTKFTIGYLPKGNTPTNEALEDLKRIGKEENCIFIQLEPNVLKTTNYKLQTTNLVESFHPLFTKFTFVLDISKSEEELMKNFHPKTRYNIRVAQKHNVKVEEQTSDEAFKKYLKLTEETTNRQKFFAHTPSYHTKMWETLRQAQGKPSIEGLSAHLLTATYNSSETNNKDETLASWILFTFHDYLYYPYGASSTKFRNVMASNLIMWEAIKFGKKKGLKYFDMWGALGNPPDTKDPWYGFHKFKEGYGATHTEFAGSFDLIINPGMYQLYKVADKARWAFLRIKKSI
jgi:lipid II:glycine glycyltransferase (peptidoglycan interpeptide bridge formation enzyme)